MASLKALLSRARARVPLLDHLLRAGKRYKADNGDRLAAGVTYFWFLSLFPILLLAISILGYALGADAEQRVVNGLGDALPPGLAETLGQTLRDAKGPAGIIGVVGLLFAGLGWVDALREALRTMWHQNVAAGNIIVKKLRDIVVLLGLFVVIGASVAVTGFVTSFSDQVLHAVNLESGPLTTAFTRILGYALALAADTALFLYLFIRLSRAKAPIRSVLDGAIFGAVGFEILKVVGGIYVARTTSKGEATYGTFAVVVGLLLFLYLASRLILFSAVFAVTAAGDSDTVPSGTADAETAIEAGIPVDLADSDPDDPPLLEKDGAPTALFEAVRGEPGTVQQTVSVPERSWSPQPPRRKAVPATPVVPAPAPPPVSEVAVPAAVPSPVELLDPESRAPSDAMEFLPSSQSELDQLRSMFPEPRPAVTGREKQVVLAARATTLAGGAVVAGIGVYAAKTVSRVLSRKH